MSRDGDTNLDERLLRPDEGAGYLRISKRKLCDLTKAKIVPCVRLGRSVRYRRESLREWAAKQEIAD